MNHEPRTKKGFTLVELLVAVSLLAMMIAFASMIFNVGIESHRTAVANAEIMQKLRAITDQINADFKGLIYQPKAKIGFGTEKSMINGELVEVRADSIMFFANGDFQSIGQHKQKIGTDEKTVAGNIAAIYYGLAKDTNGKNPREKILVRRQTILTADPNVVDLDLKIDDVNEYCTKMSASTISLSKLIAEETADPCVLEALEQRPDLDPNNRGNLVMYMAKGVDNFTIQYVGSETPDKNKDFNQWRPETEELDESWGHGTMAPQALKFTFTLYDSKGLIKDGREFTHIVYLGN